MATDQKRSKQHHHVPQVLQKQFAHSTDNGISRVWYSQRKNGVFSKPELKRTEKTFVKRNQYTVLDSMGKPSDVVEKNFYGPMDDQLDKMLKEALNIFETGRIPTFTGERLDNLKYFIFNMFARTPAIANTFANFEFTEETLKREIELGDLPEKEKLRMLSKLTGPKYIKDYNRDIKVRVIANAKPEDNKKITEEMKDFLVRWAVSYGKHSFILSDKMIHRFGNIKHDSYSDLMEILWMPITPKITLVLLKDPENKIPPKFIADENDTRDFNQFVVANSNEIASHSQYLLKSLIARDPGQSPSPSTGG